MSGLKKWHAFVICLAILPLWVPCSSAAPITAVSYEMYNGDGQAHGGSYNYWDKEYNGIGSVSGSGPKTTDREYLSGGTGNLTDGVITSQNWYAVENVAGTGPYVGWTFDPTITFYFPGTVQIDTVNVYVDDADGYGRVSLPGSIRIKMGSYDNTFVIPELDGPEPKHLVFSSLGLSGNTLELTLFRKDLWVMASEVTFDGVAVVPVPASLVLLGTGLLGLALGRRRLL